jgi:hypothetical protein
MSEPMQIIAGANQPAEIWAGINKDEATIQRFETVMKLFGLTDEQIQELKGEVSE